MKIIFAKTRHYYGSYQDYYAMVDLSGFDTCFIDEIDISASDTTYIVSPVNGELRPHIDNQRNNKPWNCKIVWWDLERIGTLKIDLSDMTGYVNEMWVSDRYFATLHKDFRFVPMGGHPGLRLCADGADKIYDYCHMSYIEGRRGHIYGSLNNKGLKDGPNGWAKERDLILRQSKTMVNIHQDVFQIGEPLRFVVAAAYSMPLFSETLVDPFPLVNGVDFVMSSYNDIANAVASRYNSDLSHMGSCLHNKLCVEYTFRDSVEKALGVK